ncbi:hypothetical protein EB796_008505 [Bugula neritina]|uniref:Uncharacterized protein n=1 Tax=Bugula neritina TaxID=10212 RepID=A0A7J7K6J9_BUGNE|nr:hypothetical protein EB796_008505 [Bugula neritina]
MHKNTVKHINSDFRINMKFLVLLATAIIMIIPLVTGGFFKSIPPTKFTTKRKVCREFCERKKYEVVDFKSPVCTCHRKSEY